MNNEQDKKQYLQDKNEQMNAVLKLLEDKGIKREKISVDGIVQNARDNRKLRPLPKRNV